MHKRLTPLRYSNPAIREHLVSQYVLGTLSTNARKRLESLMASDTSWAELVAQWHAYLYRLEPMAVDKPPSWVWKDIESVISKKEKIPFYHRVWQYKWSLIPWGCSLFLFVFSSVMLLQPTPQVATPSYIATMSSQERNDHFVLMAYKGDKPGKSRLQLEWNSQYPLPEGNLGNAMIWAKDKVTGEISLLGRFNELQSTRLLTPTEWKMIKNSSELLITENSEPNSTVLFKGACIELLSST
ncbi:hypothetical protein ABN222_16800 [Providencia alcalifaciens]|uniref:hypothetical protein n=1 Tax=Providencia sp. wls1914 TaxID=2675156 RepID=UPI0012B679B4|nr:hypothetical protein [Providencia sp. wls1914]MTC70859.1 hypothetical protein [Providencia sp. wls1914]